MIVFIVPFKPKKCCKSWDIACDLLAKTLQSICSQDSLRYRYKVLCMYTDKPDIGFTNPNVLLLETKKELSEHIGRTDKGFKIIQALEYAENLNPEYVFVVDADDLISNNLLGFIDRNPSDKGFFINKGFVYDHSNYSFWLLKETFHIHCGSCLIVKPDILKRLISADRYWYDHQGKSLDLSTFTPVPFAGAVYNIGHGENFSGFSCSEIQSRPVSISTDFFATSITAEIKKEFFC